LLTPWSVIQKRLMRYASSLRFPKLLAITTGLFVIDLFFPDVVPFVDEILLGLISLLLASLKKGRSGISQKDESRSS
jgi:Family of unknown function (DUF6116)